MVIPPMEGLKSDPGLWWNTPDELHAPGIAALVNELPEMLGLGELLILGNRHFRPEQEVGKSVFVQHAVNDYQIVSYFEVNPAVIRSEAVEGFAVPYNFAKALVLLVFIQFNEVGLRDLEGIQ